LIEIDLVGHARLVTEVPIQRLQTDELMDIEGARVRFSWTAADG
jgi:hypothetical protein